MAWESLWHVGVGVLLLALVYGFWRYKTRNKANDPVTEEATRELYDDPEHYEENREALKKDIRPS